MALPSPPEVNSAEHKPGGRAEALAPRGQATVLRLSDIFYPTNSEELRSTLQSAAAAHRSIELFGVNSKRLMAGPVAPAGGDG